MRKLCFVFAVSVTVLSMVACSGENTAAPSTSTTPTTSTTSASAAPVTTPTSTAVVVETVTETVQPAAAADNRIGYGKLKIGMSEQEAMATGMLTGGEKADNSCKVFTLKDDAGNPGGVTFSPKDGLVKIVLPKNIKTSKGIGAGSSVADVKKAYPNVSSYRAGFSVLLDGNAGLAFLVNGSEPFQDANEVHSVKITGRATDCAMAFL